jgi:hypothetical protein
LHHLERRTCTQPHDKAGRAEQVSDFRVPPVNSVRSLYFIAYITAAAVKAVRCQDGEVEAETDGGGSEHHVCRPEDWHFGINLDELAILGGGFVSVEGNVCVYHHTEDEDGGYA